MISQTVEYALRAIVTIAQQEGRPCTSREIAELTQVPSAYLSKLMQGLVRNGLVFSQRGLHGGFVLAKEPEKMTVWEIVNAVEPIRRFEKCPLNNKAHQGRLCPLHLLIDNAMAHLESMFRGKTIKDLLAQPGTASALCEEQQGTIKLDANLPPETTEKTDPSEEK